MATRKEKFDGRSRPTNSLYEQRWNEIFGKKEEEELKESYKQSKVNREEHTKNED